MTTRAPTNMIRALLYATCLCFLFLLVPSISNEVELTSEWQLLGENDTLPAGAHIRMDLSTGGRWAKLNTDEASPNQVAIDASGGVVSVEQKEESTEKFDFEMMHRALSHLPQDEQERIGLPEFPPKGASPEAKGAFQERMKEIWIQRQAELQKLDETMADLPKLLLERIKRMDAYLQNPLAELSQEWQEPLDENSITHIVSVLQDLEHQFTDIDVARDFHTLGGWAILVSLLSDDIHKSQNQTLTAEQLKKVEQIQENAAWAIGTAVKNIGEFAPWALEEFAIDGIKTTPIDMLLFQLKQNGSSNKRQKILYALGSMLRGNRIVQAHFCASGGPAVLGTILSSSSDDAKTAKRLLALADDVISDVTMHPYEVDDNIDKLIISSFSTDDFCQAPIPLLKQEALQETALETIQALEPYCQWDKKKLKASVSKVKKQRKGHGHIEELADSILSEL